MAREGEDKVAVAATRLGLSWSGTNPPPILPARLFTANQGASIFVWESDFTKRTLGEKS